MCAGGGGVMERSGGEHEGCVSVASGCVLMHILTPDNHEGQVRKLEI